MRCCSHNAERRRTGFDELPSQNANVNAMEITRSKSLTRENRIKQESELGRSAPHFLKFLLSEEKTRSKETVLREDDWFQVQSPQLCSFVLFCYTLVKLVGVRRSQRSPEALRASLDLFHVPEQHLHMLQRSPKIHHSTDQPINLSTGEGYNWHIWGR